MSVSCVAPCRPPALHNLKQLHLFERKAYMMGSHLCLYSREWYGSHEDKPLRACFASFALNLYGHFLQWTTTCSPWWALPCHWSSTWTCTVWNYNKCLLQFQQRRSLMGRSLHCMDVLNVRLNLCFQVVKCWNESTRMSHTSYVEGKNDCKCRKFVDAN